MVPLVANKLKMATVVLDNGAYTAKFGYSSDPEPRLAPNCVTKAKNVRTRIFVGKQIEDCKDLSGLYYLLPFQKGYLVNWELEKQIWDHMFGKDHLKVDFSEADIVVTEPYFNFTSIMESMNEVLFEEYQFNSIYKCNSAYLSNYLGCREQHKKPRCCLVVESGYSFTHILPYHNGKKQTEGIRRINVGGKVLTNHLKELISYRQLMVMDETYVINQCKEDVCYVSTQFWKDMEVARHKGKENTVMRDYVLPDYTHIKRGHVRPVEEMGNKAKGTEQIIRMNNERFAIPEILFHPSDVGVQEMGIAESIIHSIDALPEEMRPHMFGNIILTGGNAVLPGYRERVQMEVRAMAPDEYDVCVNLPENPITYPWKGGALLAQDPQFSKLTVKRHEYEEHGHSICEDKFDI